MSARLALPEHLAGGAFTYQDGLAAGLGRNRLAGPDLSRPFHGIRHPASQPLDLEARCRAYALRMPERAFFSSVTAAALTGLPLPLKLEQSDRVHVAVPTGSRASAARGVVGHTVHLMGGDSRLWRGLRVSSPERTWCELGAILSLEDLVAAGDHLVLWRMPITGISQLRDAVARYPGRRGLTRLHSALPLLDDHAESAQESRLRVILARAGIEGFIANYGVRVRQHQFRADLAFPAHRLIVEYEGDHHRQQWRRDMTRRSMLTSAGWLVLEVNADDLRDPGELAQRVRDTLALRGSAC